MEDRLLKLLDTEQLSSSKFADVIGVQRSSVSHILTGRNKPSFDFLQKTLKAFPMLNADWLILGEGEMYEGEHGPGGGNLFDLPAPSPVQNGTDPGQDGAEKSSPGSSSTPQESNISGNSTGGPENSRQEADASGHAIEQESGNQDQAGHSLSGQAVQNQGMENKDAQASRQNQEERYTATAPQAQRTQGTQYKETLQQTQELRNPGTDQHFASAASSLKSGEGPGKTREHDTSLSAVSSRSSKRVRRVILFYDDNSFEAYEQA